VLDRAEFRKFFKLAITAGLHEYPEGDFEVDPVRGIVRFNDPIYMLENVATDDSDSAKTFPPESVFVQVAFSFEHKTDTGLDHSSYLFGFDPDSDDGVAIIGQNVRSDIPPVPIRDDRITEFRDLNGDNIDPNHQRNMEDAARAVAVRQFNIRRSEFGKKYHLGHFWPIEAVPPVTNLVIGTDGDTPETWAIVNDVEEPLLGYPSLRQAREKFNEVLARLSDKHLAERAAGL
jgi:hypothetical protein